MGSALGQLQGLCHYLGLQWSHWSWCYLLQEAATAVRGADIWPSFPSLPVQRVLVGKDRQAPQHPMQWERLLWLCASHPCPRSPGFTSAPVPEKLLLLGGIDDHCVSARGCTATRGSSPLMASPRSTATWPQTWKETVLTKSLSQEFTDHLWKHISYSGS